MNSHINEKQYHNYSDTNNNDQNNNSSSSSSSSYLKNSSSFLNLFELINGRKYDLTITTLFTQLDKNILTQVSLNSIHKKHDINHRKSSIEYGLGLNILMAAILCNPKYQIAVAISNRISELTDTPLDYFNQPINNPHNYFHGCNALALAILTNNKVSQTLIKLGAKPTVSPELVSTYRRMLNKITTYSSQEMAALALDNPIDTKRKKDDDESESSNKHLKIDEENHLSINIPNNIAPPRNNELYNSEDCNNDTVIEDDDDGFSKIQLSIDIPNKIEIQEKIELCNNDTDIEDEENSNDTYQDLISFYKNIIMLLIDPISRYLITDPIVLLETGFIFERKLLLTHFQKHSESRGRGQVKNCPSTGEEIHSTQIKSCATTKKLLNFLGIDTVDVINTNLSIQADSVLLEDQFTKIAKQSKSIMNKTALITHAATLNPSIPYIDFKFPIKSVTAILAIYHVCVENNLHDIFIEHATTVKFSTHPQNTVPETIAKDEDELPELTETQLRKFKNKVLSLLSTDIKKDSPLILRHLAQACGIPITDNQLTPKIKLPPTISLKQFKAIKTAVGLNSSNCLIAISRACTYGLNSTKLTKEGTEDSKIILALYKVCEQYNKIDEFNTICHLKEDAEISIDTSSQQEIEVEDTHSNDLIMEINNVLTTPPRSNNDSNIALSNQSSSSTGENSTTKRALRYIDIDFVNEKFDADVQKFKRRLASIIQDQEPLVLSDLQKVYSAFSRYYAHDKYKIREVFSAYLQNMVNYTCLKTRANFSYAKKAISFLLENHALFYIDENHQAVLWTRKQQNNESILHKIAENNHVSALKQLILIAKNKFKINSKTFQEMITHKSDASLSPLCTAASAGHFDIVVILVNAMKESFGENTEEFKAQINHETPQGNVVNLSTFSTGYMKNAERREIARFLVKNHADPDKKSAKLNLSARDSKPEWFVNLQNEIATPSSSMSLSSSSNNSDLSISQHSSSQHRTTQQHHINPPLSSSSYSSRYSHLSSSYSSEKNRPSSFGTSSSRYTYSSLSSNSSRYSHSTPNSHSSRNDYSSSSSSSSRDRHSPSDSHSSRHDYSSSNSSSSRDRHLPSNNHSSRNDHSSSNNSSSRDRHSPLNNYSSRKNYSSFNSNVSENNNPSSNSHALVSSYTPYNNYPFHPLNLLNDPLPESKNPISVENLLKRYLPETYGSTCYNNEGSTNPQSSVTTTSNYSMAVHTESTHRSLLPSSTVNNALSEQNTGTYSSLNSPQLMFSPQALPSSNALLAPDSAHSTTNNPMTSLFELMQKDMNEIMNEAKNNTLFKEKLRSLSTQDLVIFICHVEEQLVSKNPSVSFKNLNKLLDFICSCSHRFITDNNSLDKNSKKPYYLITNFFKVMSSVHAGNNTAENRDALYAIYSKAKIYFPAGNMLFSRIENEYKKMITTHGISPKARGPAFFTFVVPNANNKPEISDEEMRARIPKDPRVRPNSTSNQK
jgi:hypothetical protein